MSNATERVRSYLDELSTRNTLDPEIIQNLRPEVLGEISLRVSDLHALLAALEAVEALHVPVLECGDPIGCRVCDWGEDEGWPCQTLAAITEALQ